MTPEPSSRSSYNRHLLLILLFAAHGAAKTAYAATEVASQNDPNRMLVGVNYFAGWWKPMPNKWHARDGKDWRPEYPGRIPLLGQYNDQQTMDREIAAAADHNVDFFSILWYYNAPDKEPEPNSRFLNRGLTNFLNSENAHRMKFMIEFCNHPPFDVTTDEQWDECIATWLEAMRHPSYLRVGGRLVFKIHSWHYFVIQNNKDMTRCRQLLDKLRDSVRRAGLGQLVIGAGIGAAEPIPAGHPLPRSNLFDFTATYMDVPKLEPQDQDYPYETLAQHTAENRKIHEDDAIPWLPYLPAGWCPRPWQDPRPCFALPNRNQWKNALTNIADDLSTSNNFGIPLPDGSIQKAFTIYAWNEFGEGGFLAPTEGQRYMKLECVHEVFAPKAAEHARPQRGFDARDN